MTDAAPTLLSPIALGPYELANRMVMAPMTRNRAGEGLAPTELMAAYYRQRASAGLIVTEATQISPQGIGYPNTPGIHTDAQEEGWRRVVDAVHDEGGRIFLQLWHVGRISHPSLQPDGQPPVAPSAVEPPGTVFTYQGPQPFVTPRALDLDEIPGIVRDYAEAARRSLAAGFDGVEVHGANGYLIDQFLQDHTNRRTDAYGGSIENRTRFLREVTEAVVEVCGAERVGVRLSPTSTFNDMKDSDPVALFSHAARILAPLGLAYLHGVEPLPGHPSHNGQAPLVSPHLREHFPGPLMLNGGYTRESAEEALASGAADLISFGTLFLANPDLPARFAQDAPLNTPNPATFYGGGAEGYTDYPALPSQGG